MARSEESGAPVLPSLLDRLMDDEPRVLRDHEIGRSESVEAFRRGVLRDVEWLLNSRRTMIPAGPGYPEVRDSVFNYGIPDVTSMNGDDPGTRKLLLAEVQEALRVFEPRLDASRVVLVPSTDEKDRSLRFVIEGLLRLDPSPIRVAFDTVLEVGRGRFRLRGGGDGA